MEEKMGLFDRIFGNAKTEEQDAVQTEKNTVYAPMDGMVMPLEEIGDGVFSARALGQGCGIRPSSETVVAPCDGRIVQVADTKHAVGIESPDGLEILIHVGLDTVAMNGKGFTVYTTPGSQVKCGQKLLSFDRKAIADAGYSDTTAVLITNSGDYQKFELCRTGAVSRCEKIITVDEKV